MKINNDDKLILRQSLQNRIVHYVGAFFLIFFMLFHLYFHIVRKEFDILPKKGDTKKSIEIIKAMILKKEEPKK